MRLKVLDVLFLRLLILFKSRKTVPSEEKEYDVKRANEILENVQEHLQEAKKQLAQLEEEL